MSLKGSWWFSPSGLSSFCEVSSRWSPFQIFNLTARASLQKLVKRSEHICNWSQTPDLVDINQRCSCLGCCSEIPEMAQKLMENWKFMCGFDGPGYWTVMLENDLRVIQGSPSWMVKSLLSWGLVRSMGQKLKGGNSRKTVCYNSASWRVDKRQICETVEKGMYFWDASTALKCFKSLQETWGLDRTHSFLLSCQNFDPATWSSVYQRLQAAGWPGAQPPVPGGKEMSAEGGHLAGVVWQTGEY